MLDLNPQLITWRPSRILVATDLSPISNRALNYAAALAKHFDAHIYLTHVLTGSDHPGSKDQIALNQKRREAAERKLLEMVDSGPVRDVKHTVLLEEGSLWDTLDTLIRKWEIDLVVVSTHGQKERRGEFLGSWAELILRHAHCPVMTVGPRCKEDISRQPEFEHILFATDFGRASTRAVPYACSLALEYKAVLTLLHVVEDMGTPSETEWSSEWPMLCETIRIRLLESLPSGMDQQCRLEYLVQRGDSAQEILNVSRSKKADLIVMGARLGMNLVMHLPEPTVYTVAAEAQYPVLTVGAY